MALGEVRICIQDQWIVIIYNFSLIADLNSEYSTCNSINPEYRCDCIRTCPLVLLPRHIYRYLFQHATTLLQVITLLNGTPGPGLRSGVGTTYPEYFLRLQLLPQPDLVPRPSQFGVVFGVPHFAYGYMPILREKRKIIR